jgi:cell division protein ZapA
MEQITVTISGREYRVACGTDEKEDLLACARYVDQKMSAIRAGGKVMGADRVAVLAALQITQELFSARSGDGLAVGELRKRLRQLNELAEQILAPQEKLF